MLVAPKSVEPSSQLGSTAFFLWPPSGVLSASKAASRRQK
jgi:hypothetical protein